MAVKTNERPGTRAVLRHCRMSSYKVREVLDLVRGVEFTRAVEILDHVDRAAAPVVAKLVRSAAANAEHNEGLDADEMYIASAFADEGTTLKRWRPRARGRATRIRKRTCHITVVLARMPDEKLARRRARAAAEMTERRARRVAGTRRRAKGDESSVERVEAPDIATRDSDAEPPSDSLSVAAHPEASSAVVLETDAPDAIRADDAVVLGDDADERGDWATDEAVSSDDDAAADADAPGKDAD